jgi:hypothetical protein
LKAFKFTQFLVYWLYDHKQIAIPGIGIFNLERNPASLVHGEAMLYPPSYKITFQEDRSRITDDIFYRKHKMYCPSVTKHEYVAFGISLEEKLETEKLADIHGIGKLSVSAGQIVFEQDHSTANLLSRYYPNLKMKFFSTTGKAISWLDLKLSQLPHKFWSVYLPLLSSLALLLSVFILNKIQTGRKLPQPEEKTEPPKKAVTDTTANIEGLLDSILQSSNDVQLDSVGVTPEGLIIKQCIIITGAYRSEMYKNLMIQKIQQEGYKVYVEEINGLVRVGLQFECTDATLVEMLEKIRSTFDKNAWHLEDKEE